MTDIKKKWNFQIAPVSGNYRIMSARPKDTQLITTGFNTLSKCRYGWMLYHSADQYVGGALRKYGEFSEGEVTIFRQLLRSGMLWSKPAQILVLTLLQWHK